MARSFRQAASLVERRIRDVGQSRGFAVSRLVTHWTEVVGADFAQYTQPVKVTYGRGGFGATLTVLTSAAHAPVIQMQLPRLKERVNACYGYNAVTRIVLTQTAPHGFDAHQATAQHPGAAAPDTTHEAQARRQAADVQDTHLREALASLGARVLHARAKKRSKG